MKFYKVHAAKYKNEKIFLMPDQFDEIGPDAFTQTDFDAIILSENVSAIRDHAFAGVSSCKILLSSSVSEIDPFAFDDIGSNNEIFCFMGSFAHKFCMENHIEVNTDVVAVMGDINKAMEEEAAKAQASAEKAREKAELEAIKDNAVKEAEEIKAQAAAQAEKILAEAYAEAERIRNEAIDESVEIKMAAMDEAEKIREEALSKAAEIKANAFNAAGNMGTGASQTPVTPPRPAPNTHPLPINQKSPYQTPKNTNYNSTPVFRDEEHSSHKTYTGQAPKPPVKPVTYPNAKVGSMKNIDAYDEEAQRMQKEKNKKGGFFG